LTGNYFNCTVALGKGAYTEDPIEDSLTMSNKHFKMKISLLIIDILFVFILVPETYEEATLAVSDSSSLKPIYAVEVEEEKYQRVLK